MRDYPTKDQLRRWGAEVENRRNLREAAEKRSPTSSTFLSHSSKDVDLIDGAMRILRNNGAAVYIDKIDPSMPPYTNSDTAGKLKDRIGQCRKFVLLATENSKESKWVPWELGIADAKKGLSSIALFPAVDSKDDYDWTSWEYMGLYDKILWGDIDGYSDHGWKVVNVMQGTATWLSDWLSR